MFILSSCVVYKFQCGRCNPVDYIESDMCLEIRSGEHIGISLLALHKTKDSVCQDFHGWIPLIL